MKKITILLILTSIISYGQESILFKTEFKPNKKYITQAKTTTYSEVNFIADQEIMDRIKSKGIELPIIVKKETNISTNIITHNRNENGEIPATIQYGEFIEKTTKNGKTTTEIKPYSGMKILGKYDTKNKFVVDTIIGDKLTQQMRNVLSTVFKSVQQQIDFPEKPLKVGDDFKSEIPLTIPMEGLNPVYVKINMTYLLKEIKDNKALFDLKQTISLDMTQSQINATANGTGTGKSEYDIQENYLTGYTSELPMNLTIRINEKMTAKVKTITKSEQTVIIE